MLRRNIRERKVYLYRKALETVEEKLLEKKQKLKHSLNEGKPIPPELRQEERHLRNTLELDDAAANQRVASHIDDEYAYAGVKDPKVIITTSRDPSSRLRQFVKELRLLIPNSQRINRGSYIIKDVVQLCRSNDVTDILLVHETRGEPDCLVVCHLPHGPTAYFSISDVVLRHDLPEKPSTISEVAPHLIFENFTSKLGLRLMNILKYLFPPPRPTAQRVQVFINQNDSIRYRHYTWEEKSIKSAATGEPREENTPSFSKHKLKDIQDVEDRQKMDRIILAEIGPRFNLKPFRIELGTLEMKDLDFEWALRPYFNKPKATLA